MTESSSSSSPPQSQNRILVIGLGELGTAIVDAITSHSAYSTKSTSISVLLRPSTLSSPSPAKAKEQSSLISRNVNLIPADTATASEKDLTTIFQDFGTVIHANGMTLPPGSQLKITRAVLAAKTVKLYIPWQFGVDYDVIGPDAGGGLFAEAFSVRELLRSSQQVSTGATTMETKWLIVSCGIFMSFLLEPFWGVIERLSSLSTSGDNDGGQVTRVNALGSWDDLLTATTARDIGRCTAELILVDKHLRNQSVYIAGETLTYRDFADLVEKANGRKTEREVWTTEHLRRESKADPDDKLKKYRVVFSEGKGLAWKKEESYNEKKGIEMEGFKSCLSKM